MTEYNAMKDVELLLLDLSLGDFEGLSLIEVIAHIAATDDERKKEMNTILANALTSYDFFKTNRLLEDELEEMA